MKEYDGPAYSNQSSPAFKRFNRKDSSRKDAPFKFKPAIEERIEASSKHRPVYHHEQPWRDTGKVETKTPRQVEEVDAVEEMPGYEVPFLEKQSGQPAKFNRAIVTERMKPEDPPNVAMHRPVNRPPLTSSNQSAGGATRFEWQRPTEAAVQAEQMLPRARRVAQEMAESDTVSDEKAKPVSKREPFQPKQLPKPYQTPDAIGEVSRVVLQRMTKKRQDYLLFEMKHKEDLV